MRLQGLGSGVYTILAEVNPSVVIEVGSLGPRSIFQGLYAYTGSALGKGASSLWGRITRHLNKGKTTFWHIDYFTNHTATIIMRAVCSATRTRMECEVNREILKNAGVRPLPKFGATDCRFRCGTHMVHTICYSLEEVEAIAIAAHRLQGLSPISLKFNQI